jgi:hypothetical protein
MPPTTGGNTSGSRISGRINRTSRAVLRASTRAIGTPSNTHSTVLAAAVFRLSNSAVLDEELVINDQKFGQSTLIAIASSGSTTKVVPTAAGMYTQRGRLVGRCTVVQGLAKPDWASSLWPVSEVTRATNFCAMVDCGAFFNTPMG